MQAVLAGFPLALKVLDSSWHFEHGAAKHEGPPCEVGTELGGPQTIRALVSVGRGVHLKYVLCQHLV